MSERPVFTQSEIAAAASVAALAGLVVAAYLVDWAGGSFTPRLMLPVLFAGGVGTWIGLGGRRTVREDALVWSGLVAGICAWLVWIARPAWLPLGTGPDLTHHLLLIGYIEKHWRLVHVPGVEDFLGEMVYYTPGSHILVALAGAWSGSTGFRALHTVVAATVALKAGYVFLIARRALPPSVPRSPIAACAAVALFASQTYFLGSFAEYSFLAQVVAELFAVAMWWGLIVWEENQDPRAMVFVGLAGAATFLVWPVFIGPPALLAAALFLRPRHLLSFKSLVHASLAAVPIVLVAALFIAGRAGMMMIAGSGGDAVWPEVSAYGWPFLVLSTAGLAACSVAAALGRTPAWPSRESVQVGPAYFGSVAYLIPLFAAVILLQAAGLFAFARANGNAPYMALKMFYLLLYPQAVGVAMLIGALFAWQRWASRPGLGDGPGVTAVPLATGSVLAWVVFAVAVVLVGRPLVGAPASLTVGQHPATSAALHEAGEWARARLPPGCVEYLVSDDETAYWLHLAVLGNPRQGARTADNATYELTPTLVRWLTPGGLPYAIADLPALPRGIRDELDIVASFGTAAVVKRRGPSSCDVPQ